MPAQPRRAPRAPRAVSPRRAPRAIPKSQRGVVLLIALVVLVALTLAATTLVRSVDTTNLIAGNLAFHESAVLSGERGTEFGFINWLSAHSLKGDTALYTNNAPVGYLAARQDPDPGVSWDTFWNTTLKNFAFTEAAKDAAGNTVSYVIHRLCDAEGAPEMATCYKAKAGEDGSSHSTGGVPLATSTQVFYRITTRIAGPRNTVAYIQTIIAL
jgi:Tfp pilus assembly protein PilX